MIQTLNSDHECLIFLDTFRDAWIAQDHQPERGHAKNYLN